MAIDLEGRHSPEVYLWRAVITQAISDATLPVRPPRDKAVDMRSAKAKAGALRTMQANIRIRDEAREWLLDNSRNFREVCEMALLEPAAVRESAQALAKRGWPEPQVILSTNSARYRRSAA